MERVMSKKVLDVDEVQRALDRAARNARYGSSEFRAGKVLVGREMARDQLVRTRRRDKAPVRPAREK
jgi:hypothetical protein